MIITPRRSLALALVAATAVTWFHHVTMAGAATAEVHIRSVDVHAFPQVTVTASITGRGVSASDVHVTEGGNAVSGATVTPLSQTGRRVDVVLVLDTSNSMKGAPLASAIAAALKFVTTLPSNQPINVGIVEFATRPTVVQGLTPNRSALLTKLGSLKTTQGTALYDGVITASHLFTGSAQHNIVVLSDGADQSSNSSLQQAVGAAKAAHAAVFTVGLSVSKPDVQVLQALAQQTGGRYGSARTADLSNTYAQLAGEISNQFAVTYRSTRKAGGQVEVAVSAGGTTDQALVLEPKVAPPPPPPPPPTAGPAFLRGTVALMFIVITSFIALFLLFNMVFGARARRKRDEDLVKRVAAAPEPQEDLQREGRGIVGFIPAPMVQAGARVAEATGTTTKVELMLERAGLPFRTGEFVSGVGLIALAGVVIGGVLLHNPIFMLIVGVAFAVIPIVVVKIRVNKRNAKLHDQLPDILMILASSLRAGHGFFQALDLVAKEIGEPGSVEFGRVVAEVRLGRPVDEAMNAMAERVGSDDFRWAVLGVNIQREVGGNLAEILDTIAETVRERDAVRRQVQVLSAEGRLSIGILASLPFLVSLYMAKVNPGYLNLLFSTRVGLIMLVTAAALLCAGIFWMRKIVKIDV